MLRVAPNRDASLVGPARLLDALRAWRAVFDPPKVRVRRFDIAALKRARGYSLGALAARLHAEELDWTTIAKVNGLKIHPSNAKAVAMRKRAAKKLRMP